MSDSLAPEPVLAALEAGAEADLARLLELIRIPSVSADPHYRADVRRAADYLAEQFRAAGPFDVTVHDTPGNPVVTAEWRQAAAKAPTVLVYGHYDVQPPDPLEKWHSPPFEPTLKDGRIYARGASDDKSPMFLPLTVARAYIESVGSLPVNLIFLVEGEEEVGSPSLPGFLDREKSRLAADVVVSADGGMWRADHPSTMISARGITALEFTLRAAAKDLHSGRHGGGLANPLHAMAAIVASLHDQDGRVAVAGFYDQVRDLSPALRDATARLPFTDADYLAEVGAPATFGESGYTTLERQWYRPTLELNGLWGGYTGHGSKTVLPSEAHAKITCRLVADQDPVAVRAAVIAHLQRHLPVGVELHVDDAEHSARAYHLPEGSPALTAVIGALRAEYDTDPWIVGLGGTVPVCETFQTSLGMDTVFFSFAVGDEDIHAPNEFFRLNRFHEGRRAWADLFQRLAVELRHD